MNTPDAQSRIARELGRSERLLWSGAPRQGLMLQPADAFLIPFSLLWGGFAIFWEVSVLTMGGPSFFALFGVPFVLVGLYMIVGRFFFDAYARGRTVYAVTDERVIIVSGVWVETVQSLALRTLAEVSLREKADGSGTVTFGPNNPFAMFAGAGWPQAHRGISPSFVGIADVRSVYETVRAAQRSVT